MDILGIVDINGWILLVVFLLLALYLRIRWKFGLWRRLGVPGPDYLPYIGALKEMSKLGLMEFDFHLIKTYGRVVGTYLGSAPSLLIADPDIIKNVCVKDFSKAPNRYEFSESQSELRKGLNALEDDHWRFVRNTLLPTFSSGKMRKMNPLLQQKYELLLQGLKKDADAGKTIEFKEVFGRFTMDVIASLGFGMEIDSQTDPNNAFVRYAKELFNVNFSLLLFLTVIIPKFDVLLNYFKISPTNNRRVMDFFKSAVRQAIEMRDEGDQNRKDLLQLMLNAHKDTDKNEVEEKQRYEGDPQKWKDRSLTEEEVTGNSIFFLIAGFDTTSTTMTTMAYSLATNPEIQERLVNQIDSIIGRDLPTYDNVQKVDYLDWVFNETLRLYPPAVRTNRKSKTEIDVAGYKIPKDVDLSFAIYVLHRDPEYWTDPEKFDPERFR
ncbi:cytochrome P450 3A24-like isoform X2 [Ostrea edulis]|uniref:cytochrome P450 3A24-like isoform X2 n=1 Tax=Ostrea edulis TaxID=37623 RepID=UPI0024AE9E65|nr:cytochrome P450 3A24-like isoform X2 [Ostrea edulis]